MTGAMLPEPLVTCVGVTRTFGTGPAAVVAVHSATLQILPGERIAVTGPSGSGKSTLLHLLAGLEPPSAGTVTWAGSGRRRPAHDIGVVFQGPSLIPALTTAENTALPLLLAGLDEADAGTLALEALAAVGVADLAGRLPEDLSGGQSQRVAVARVLAQRPKLVLADEPTGKLDRETGRHVVDVLLRAADDLGAALVVSTHDPAVSGRLRQRWTMRQGRLGVPDGPAVAQVVEGVA
jgi:putative ABC transport system ATP-binding protein